MRNVALGAALAAALSLTAVPGLAAQPPASEPESYIVVLDNSVADVGAVAEEHSRRYGVVVTHVYQHSIKGYAANFPETTLSDVRGDTRVRHVERDQTVTQRATQSDPPWGLDRIDQSSPPLDQQYTYQATGRGVVAYVVDTGIRVSHTEFSGSRGTRRARVGFDALGGDGDDCNGHGTHVAGTLGGRTAGVAKEVELVAVRVIGCDGQGSISGVVAGIDFVAGDHEAGTPAVANLSLGSAASPVLDTAVASAVLDGVVFAVAAGNGNFAGLAEDACLASPARVPEVITVGATERDDAKASFSNFGDCLDVFAPGVGIRSAWAESDTATNTISGTSMASPHVAGVAALYLEGQPRATPAAVAAALGRLATKGVVTGARSAHNHLLFTKL